MPDVPELPHEIRSQRLRLVLITPADAADMLAGRRQDRWHPDYPRQDDIDGASMGGQFGSWGSRHVVLGGQAVGSVGFFGPPDDGEVEVGYGLVDAVRRQGLATEALRAVLAETDRLGIAVRGRTEPDNGPSLRVLAKAGFTELRGSDDEGYLVMARPARALSRLVPVAVDLL